MKAIDSRQINYYFNRLLGKRRGGPIVLHRYKAVYFPIPKVACSSVTKFCANLLDMKEGPDTDIHKLYYPSLDVNKTGRCDRYFKFAFVRNPWDRVLSCYSNKILQDPSITNTYYKNGIANSFVKYDGVFTAGMPFNEFVHIIKDWPDQTADPHFRSQHTYLENKDGDLVVDYIGHFESLADDFDYVVSKLNVPQKMLPHLKKSVHNNYWNSYDEDLIQVVGERYARDIELFGYDFIPTKVNNVNV